MLKVYSSQYCPHCVVFKYNLDLYGLEYELIDINTNIHHMRDFLALRDKDENFIEVKKQGRVGIPCLIEDDKVSLDWQQYLEDKGLEIKEPEKNSCGLHGC